MGKDGVLLNSYLILNTTIQGVSRRLTLYE